MELPILKDKNIFPTNEVLADVLETSFPAFETFSASAETAGLTLEWNYYNDGKVWLCKVLSKKKNLAWLVVYQNYLLLHRKASGSYRRHGNYGKHQRGILPGET